MNHLRRASFYIVSLGAKQGFSNKYYVYPEYLSICSIVFPFIIFWLANSVFVVSRFSSQIQAQLAFQLKTHVFQPIFFFRVKKEIATTRSFTTPKALSAIVGLIVCFCHCQVNSWQSYHIPVLSATKSFTKQFRTYLITHQLLEQSFNIYLNVFHQSFKPHCALSTQQMRIIYWNKVQEFTKNLM